jgi:replication factor A1
VSTEKLFVHKNLSKLYHFFVEEQNMINFTSISKLEDGDKSVNVKGIITYKSAERKVKSRISEDTFRVCNFTLADETGVIELVLWENNIDKIALNDEVAIEYGFVTDFKGEKQLNVGKYGKIVRLNM